MSRRLRPALATVVVLGTAVLAAPAPADAFDTGPHSDITSDALRAEGFSQSAADVVRLSNWLVDLYSTASSVPQSGHAGTVERLAALVVRTERWSPGVLAAVRGLHFDRLGTTMAVEAEWERLLGATQVEAARARDAEGGGRPLDLLIVLGISLHALQDFYSHSNWVEPFGVDGYHGPGWSTAGSGDTPTWFDIPPGIRLGATIYTGDGPGRRGHGTWQSDANRNLRSGMAKDWPGRPLHRQAHMTAYFATRQWVRALRSWVNDDAFWRRAQRVPATYALTRDLRGLLEISLYAGRLQGHGEPCHPVKGCSQYSGPAGSLLSLRQAVNRFFEGGRSAYRKRFEALAPLMAATNRSGRLVPFASSADLQRETRFVELQVLSMRGIDLGDPGPDRADLYVRAAMLGQSYHSPVIHGHDSFGFPGSHYPFTWFKAVRNDYRGDTPVTEITIRVRTSSSPFSGTDDPVVLRLGPRLRFPLDKSLVDDFERGADDTYSVPIDEAVRAGLRLGDLRELTLEKAPDGIGGAWKLRGVTLQVNGQVVYSKDGIERWVRGSRGSWTASDFSPRASLGTAIPVWLELREDDLAYGANDKGDIHPHADRYSVAVAYAPGTTVERTVTGGSLYGGRRGDGGKASLRYRLRSFASKPPPLPPAPQPPPPAGKADLVITMDSVSFTVRNQGTAASGPFTVTVLGFGTYRINGLAVGQSVTRTYTERCLAGMREAIVDSLNEIDELDETNNTATALAIC